MRSSRISRRGLLAVIASALPFAAARSVAAQTDVNGCEIGFVNGLLQIDPACNIAGAGGPAVTAPAHLAQQVIEPDPDTETLSEVHAEQAAERRNRKHNKKGGRRDRRREKRGRRRDDDENRRERRARRTTCDDFDWQEEAQEWHDDHSQSRLIENDDGDVCLHLPLMYPPPDEEPDEAAS